MFGAISDRSHTDLTPISHQSHTNLTPISHQRQIGGKFQTDFRPISGQSHTNLTPTPKTHTHTHLGTWRPRVLKGSFEKKFSQIVLVAVCRHSLRRGVLGQVAAYASVSWKSVVCSLGDVVSQPRVLEFLLVQNPGIETSLCIVNDKRCSSAVLFFSHSLSGPPCNSPATLDSLEIRKGMLYQHTFMPKSIFGEFILFLEKSVRNSGHPGFFFNRPLCQWTIARPPQQGEKISKPKARKLGRPIPSLS